MQTYKHISDQIIIQTRLMLISCLPGNCLRLHHLFFLVKTSSSSGGEVNSSKQVLVELLRIPKRRDLS